MVRVDRFIVVVSAAVVLVLVLTVGSLALAQHRRPAPLPDTTPTGVVYHYLTALDREDYETAYAYLSSVTRAWVTLDDFRHRAPRPPARADAPATSVSLTNERVTGDRARVTVTVTTFTPAGPFGVNENTYSVDLDLVREGDAWKIDVPPQQYHRLYPRGF